ncbi:MAG: HRDC domain-containing protein [Candidatus Woesearchaeota archaeon]|jgi:ribonuclease D
MNNFSLVQTPEQLNQAAKEWELCSELGIDLECENNLHHYGVFISIIQISSRDKNWIVDVIKLKEIQPLIKVLEEPQIVKIFHDVSFDFRILNHQFKCNPKNVFDTQIASLLLGKENLGLGSLLEEFFHFKKEKKFQRVDWCRRPLTPEMLEYAVKDTFYLLDLKQKLIQELTQKGRLSWMEQECQALEKMDFTYQDQQYLDLHGAKKLDPHQLAALHALFDLREKTAKKVDRPNFMIMHNDTLMELVLRSPKDLSTWKKLNRVHPIVKTEASMWLNSLISALEGPGEVYEAHPKKLSEPQRNWKEEITDIRNSLAKPLGIRSHLLLNNDQIIEIVLNKNLAGLRIWQKELIKDQKIIKEIIRK